MATIPTRNDSGRWGQASTIPARSGLSGSARCPGADNRGASFPKSLHPTGLEPVTLSPKAGAETTQSLASLASCGKAQAARCQQWCQAVLRQVFDAGIPAELRLVIEAWDSLPAAIKAGILALVEASGGARG